MSLGGKLIRVLAVALMFWCAGAGCLMVSYARSAEAQAADSALPASDAAVPACHAHKQKTREATKSRTSTTERAWQLNLPLPSRSGSMSCCPLTSGSIAAASRPQSNNSAPAVANASPRIPDSIHSTSAPLTVPLRLPNRAHSYLLDCAFLI